MVFQIALSASLQDVFDATSLQLCASRMELCAGLVRGLNREEFLREVDISRSSHQQR